MKRILKSLMLLTIADGQAAAQGFDTTECLPVEEPAFGAKFHLHLCADGKSVRQVGPEKRITCPEEHFVRQVKAFLDDSEGDDPSAELVKQTGAVANHLKEPGLTECRHQYLNALAAEYERLAHRLATETPAPPAASAPAPIDPHAVLRQKEAAKDSKRLVAVQKQMAEQLGVKVKVRKKPRAPAPAVPPPAGP